MTNENKNINELVIDDDDPTVEFEALADTFGFDSEPDSAPSVDELQSDLRSRAETIDRLQFDIEQLRSRWTGLETEIKAREELTTELNNKLAGAEEQLAQKDELLRDREALIDSLKTQVHEGNAAGRATDSSDRERESGRLASATAEAGELHARLESAEIYADDLRRRLQDLTEVADDASRARDALSNSLDFSRRRSEQLEEEVTQLQAQNAALEERLARIHEDHDQEIRMIRFELGEAQETIAQQELVTEQLASDLVDTRGFRDELEKMLTRTEEDSVDRIDRLERENKRLKERLADDKEKLESNSEAMNCLLTELARKSKQLESIGEIGEVIHDIDDRMTERIEERIHRDRDRDRMSRVLIGTVDGQELRFPLFKDRLTIGRTEQNDIQLKASYVSRRHAVIVTDHERTRVIDWGSKNGVFVNSDRVTEHFLKNGDSVRIGTAEFRYEERPKRDS
jgi:chromosome segregation ATPase